MKAVPFSEIFNAVCDYYDVVRVQLLGPDRHMRIARSRHIVVFLARELTEMSFGEIALRLDRKDHTTALYGYRRIKRDCAADDELRAQLENIKRNIEQACVAVPPT